MARNAAPCFVDDTVVFDISGSTVTLADRPPMVGAGNDSDQRHEPISN